MFARKVICPFCQHKGTPRKKSKGSFVVGLLLCLLFLLPGILYFIFMSGYHKVCRNCGMTLPAT